MSPWIIFPAGLAIFCWWVFITAAFQWDAMVKSDILVQWCGFGVAALGFSAWTLDIAGVKL